MKRSFLTALGLEKDIIDQIMSEYGNSVELIKEKTKEDYDAKVEKSNKTITDLQDKLNNAIKKGHSGKDWETEYDTLKAEYDTLKAQYDTDIAAKDKELSDFKAATESEKAIAAKQSILRNQLEADGANPKLVKLLEKEFDIAKIELDGEKIKDWETVSKSVKDQYAEIFGKKQVRGTDPADPPAGGSDKNPWAKESRNLAEQTRIYREDPARALELAKAAGTNL